MKTALVTGTSSGIGAAIAARLLADGWAVLGVSRRPPAAGIEHLSMDLATASAADIAAALVGRDIGAMVHAAGLLRVAPLGALDPADGQAMWRLHVDVASALADAVIPRMAPGGRVVLIGSRTAAGAPGRSQYAASKAALVGMARSWAAEVAPRGITVNVVAPGATDTPMLTDPARAGMMPKLPPLGRFVRPDEVAGLVGFLLGDYGGSITGQQIVVCGGASI